MNLEEVINDPRVAELIDYETIPDKDDPAYEFFENTVELILEEKEGDVKERSNYVGVMKFEGVGLALTPAVFSFHESLHALAAELIGAKVEGFSFDSWGIYTEISGTHAQAAFVSIFPHFIFPIALYYSVSKKKMSAIPFMAPTLAEFFPYELFNKVGDFMITATYISSDYYIPIKYLMLGAFIGGSYMLCKLVDKFKKKD